VKSYSGWMNPLSHMIYKEHILLMFGFSEQGFGFGEQYHPLLVSS